MITMNLAVTNLNEIRSAFERAPKIVKKHLNNAIARSIFIIENNGNDRYFQFKTPRSLRTGFLERSFKLGIKISELQGSIGPRTPYAAKVYSNNRYMDRISDASLSAVTREFDKAVENIADDIISLTK